MSAERARKALRGELTDRIPLYETPTHPDFLNKLTGINPFTHTVDAVLTAIQKLDIDMTNLLPPQTDATADDTNLYNIYHVAEWRRAGEFDDDIWSYDPIVSRHLPSVEAMTAETQQQIDRDRALLGDGTLLVGLTFTTCMHYAAEELDWETFFMACVGEEERIDDLLDRFEAASLRITQSYANTDIEVMFTHDDIAMNTGLLLSPRWMREHIIPRYQRVLKPFKDKGIPILFATDGNFLEIAPDIVAAGADGFFLDTPCVLLEQIVEQCGPDLAYYTGPAPALMETGTARDVRDEMRRMADIARDLPRFFWHMPGGMTYTMPTENVRAFYEGALEFGQR